MLKPIKKLLRPKSDILNATCYMLHARHRKGPVSPSASRGGQLLIEMLVALGILTMGFLGVTSLLSRALSLNRVVSDNYTATYLASEGVEVVKNILDGNVIQGPPTAWNAGVNDGDFEVDFESTTLTPSQDRYLSYDTFANRYGYGYALAKPFKRTIRVQLNGANEVIVNSEVSWVTRGGGSFSLNLEDHFFNWR